MTLFFNKETKEYPRYTGDLELLGWKEGQALPDNWVEVIGDIPDPQKDRYYVEKTPLEIDGIWKRQFDVVFLTEEEIAIRFPVEQDLEIDAD